MLNKVDLRFSETGLLSLPMSGVTLFVGPNNSGKSLVLREIEQLFYNWNAPDGLQIVDGFEVQWPTPTDVAKAIDRMQRFQRPGVSSSEVIFGRLNAQGTLEATTINREELSEIITSAENKDWLLKQFSRWGTIRLDGRTRFDLTNDQRGGDLLDPPESILALLFTDEDARAQVKQLVWEAFALHFVIDPTNLGQLRIRLSKAAPKEDEQSLGATAREFFRSAQHISEASDGVQAFIGLVTAICSGEFHTILVDEPEAFLHPPLARLLGRNLTEITTRRKGSLIVSTHSSDFLMGCLQASADVRVVRLTYQEGKSSASMIDSQALSDLYRKPLMRSSNVISGLFHDGVVICESDNDRAFYSEIYHRITLLERGLPSLLFVNAQNKQTIRDILEPLRAFGVPAAATVDIDMIKEGGTPWMSWLQAARFPERLRDSLAAQRRDIKEAFDSANLNMKDGGVSLLSSSDRDAAIDLFDRFAEYGVFVVQRGELEKWLPELTVPGKGTEWTVAMLEKLGSDPANPGYVQPTTEDVWAYLRKVASWVMDPQRKGL